MHGLNAHVRRVVVRTLVDDVKPSIICLQETKLDVISQFLILSMLGRDFSDYAYLPASHTRGGILIAGRQSDVAFSDVLVGCYSITVLVSAHTQSVEEPRKWWLTAVYGP